MVYPARLRKNLIIIFEGADRTGKSNIAQALSKSLQIPYFKYELEQKTFKSPDAFFNLLQFGMPLLTDFLWQTRPNVILDRSYPSEIVYSQIFNRKTDLDLLTRTDEKFREMNAVMVLCYKDKVVEKDDLVDEADYEQIKQAYFDLKLKIPTFRLNTSEENLNEQLHQITNWLLTFRSLS